MTVRYDDADDGTYEVGAVVWNTNTDEAYEVAIEFHGYYEGLGAQSATEQALDLQRRYAHLIGQRVYS